MPPNLQSLSSSSPASATEAGPPPARRAPPRRTTSGDLLAGAVELLIEHRGEVYRLRRTAQDKLILTK